MSLDGIMLKAIKKDLENKLISGRIDKIYQVDKKLLTLTIRNNNKNYNLLLSSHPRYPRTHLTELSFENPVHPPDFCMLLRKYIMRGIITKINQPDFERILNFHIKIHGKIFYLFVEIMGKYSNISLVDKDEIILDSLKRIGENISRQRQLYPGIKYKYPPKQNKLNPLNVNKNDFFDKITDGFSKAGYKAVMYNFRGIGPDSAREIVFRAGLNPQIPYLEYSQEEKFNIWESFYNYFDMVKNENFQLTIGLNKDKRVNYFSAFPLKHINNIKDIIEFDQTGKLMDFYYNHNIKENQMDNLKKELNDIVEKFLKKNRKKQKQYNTQLKDAQNADKYKKMGELITANIYQMKKGQKEIEVTDYYNKEQAKIKIKLDPQKTPSENAQRYFKKYNKSKRSVKFIKKQLGILRHEEKYLEQVELNIQQAEDKTDIKEIKTELKEEGYIRTNNQKKNKKGREKPLPPHRFKSTEGYDILAGRSNKQNDYLTKKMANSKDIWLHTKKIAGSHVIIRNHTRDEIPDKTLKEAAVIAAYYSKGRMSENVPVDFTEVKNVKKPKGAKPGLVYYEEYKTIYADPNEGLVKRLKK